MQQSLHKYFPWFVVTGILLNATGLTNDILDPDGTLYATIAKHMALTNDWINLWGDDHDWLDKPHFPFWITALSYKLFGLTAFAYKLPGFLFWLAGARFTYLIAKDLYGRHIAEISTLIYMIALHGVLANFDVRAEPYLATLTVGSIWYWIQDYKNPKWYYLVLTAVFAACAVMTKGIFALLTIAGGFVIYWLSTKQWKQLINLRWWLLAALILLFITPELYCLYMQFDAHPEKVVFGQTGVSGIRFFFWDSQFGRFFNTGPIKGSGDMSFFLHTTLWAFLPWSPYFYYAVVNLFRKGNSEPGNRGWMVYGGALLTFVLFSLSKFQLPHYIIILFPMFSILTGKQIAQMFDQENEKAARIAGYIQTGLIVIAAALIITLCMYTELPGSTLVITGTVFFLAVIVFTARKSILPHFMLKSFAFGVLLYPFLNFIFYPFIMQYQSGMQAAKYINANNVPGTPAMYKEFSHAFEFYAPGEPAWLDDTTELNHRLSDTTSILIYTRKAHLDTLQSLGYPVQTVKDFDYFRISMLTTGFLNNDTRSSVVTPMVLANIGRKNNQ